MNMPIPGFIILNHYKLFATYARDLIESDLKPKEEAYISLISNKVIKNNGSVLITKLEIYMFRDPI